MAAVARFSTCLSVGLLLASFATASPVGRRDSLTELFWPNGTIMVLDKATNQYVAQGSASDGSGEAFSAMAIIWIVYAFAVGVPLALGSIRLWRFNSGIGIGVFVTMCCQSLP